jgi:hypothetical protein
MVSAVQVQQTADVCTSFLVPLTDADWTVGVPDLEMTVAQVVAHAAEGPLWYAIDLAAGGKDLTTVEHRVNFDGAPAVIVDTLRTYADIVAAVIEAAPDDARGIHPLGMADPSGFAAMACDEMLIHTDDAARGLGQSFAPPPELAQTVLTRLFPWVSAGDDPWSTLRWANGRIALDDRPRLARWRWHCAPLGQWDGTDPNTTNSPA